MNIYKYIDYKKFIRETINKNKTLGKRHSFTLLAQSLGVQKTYISKVLNSDSHLNSDQTYLLSEYFALDENQSIFLQLLVEYARTGLTKRKKLLKSKIVSLQSHHREPEKYVSPERIVSTEAAMSEYYLDPTRVVIHQFLFIPHYQKNPQDISRQLRLSASNLEDHLETLQRLGLIDRSPGKPIAPLANSLQLSSSHPICKPHQKLMRLLSMEQLAKVEPEQKLTFSTSFTCKEETKAEIHQLFLDCLREVADQVKSSQAERCYQINLDIFPWETET